MDGIVIWIAENKSWLFDGLGVAIIFTIGGWFFSKKNKASRTKQTQKSGDNSLTIQAQRDVTIINSEISKSPSEFVERANSHYEDQGSNLTIKDIIENIKKQKPYLRKETAKSYEGLYVNWDLEFLNIEDRRGSTTIMLTGTRVSGFAVIRNVNLSSYPQFKSIDSGYIVNVIGNISKVDDKLIYLTNCEFYF